ncbi:MAG: UDP-N-acetylmuramate dehydrogenase [Actinomycetes bacterium]
MRERHDLEFSELTTLRVGGPAARLIEATSRDELINAVASTSAEQGLVIAGGSNLVVADAGVHRPVIAVRTAGVTIEYDDDRAVVVAAAGENWDRLVERCVAEGLSGIEALSGIPGSVGATPIQNVGAYGQEVCEVISRVEVLDRLTSEVRSLTTDDCRFRYRSSVFKAAPDRFVVLAVEFRLPRVPSNPAVKYAELAARLGVKLGGSAPASEVREAVLELRRAKGMVLDPLDHDTWSAGSFFTNPILSPSEIPAAAPKWPHGEGRMKTSAAWLIEQAGYGRGFGADLGSGRATLSTKHTLAITNRGNATAEDVLLLARTVRRGVLQQFGIALEPEPMLVDLEI